MPQTIILKSEDGRWLYFNKPLDILTAYDENAVVSVIDKAQKAAFDGKYAVGFVSYEAANALDSSLKVKDNKDNTLPLAWFAVCEQPEIFELKPESGMFNVNWQIDTTQDDYNTNIDRIKTYIEKGYTYQVNYTVRLSAEFKYKPYDFFASTAQNCDAKYCSFIETDDFAICSFSPELFFTFDNGLIETRPIKGTIARGLTYAADKNMRQSLADSEKDKAENVMIVDMIRNDLGKLADCGTVEVPELFTIEKYPTLYQMSSTVKAQTTLNAGDVLKGVFPCASITGAPKCRTMKIISELEKSPRGIYTGSIGHFAPNNKAVFNVAIRTVAIDKLSKTATYGTGGGIVWDSKAESEYNECLTKARVLTQQTPDFLLLESLLWTPESGYYLERLHLERLAESAEYFGFKFDGDSTRDKMNRAVKNCTHGKYKVRLLLDKNGEVTIDIQPISTTATQLKIKIANKPVNSEDVFLYHKTTNRSIYDDAYSQRGECDEVILWNEKGEVTECTFHNIIFEKDGNLYTPPVECGLLAGTMRQQLLESRQVSEKVILLDQIDSYDAIYLINSVRGKRKATLV